MHSQLLQDQDKKIRRKVFNWLGELERRRGNTDLASEYYNKVIRLCEPQNLDTDKTKAIALLNYSTHISSGGRFNQSKGIRHKIISIKQNN